jgi:hypothetical protein
MFGTTSDSMFGEDGTFAGDYGAPPAMPVPGVPQVPGTVISAEAALPAGVKAQPGTVIVSQTPLPAGVKAQPGTVVVADVSAASRVPEFATVRPLSTVGRGGRSINGGLPPLPAGQPPGIDTTLWMTGLGTNMPLPGRPVGSTPYPYDMQRFRGETVGSYFGQMKPGMDYWSGTDVTYRDVKSVNYAADGYVYRVYNDPEQSIDVIKKGKLVAKRITAASSPAAYNAIMAEIQGKKRVDPALLVAAINAGTIIGVAAVSALGPKPKKRKAFEASAAAAPVAEPVSTGIPTWVWVAGGGVVLAGIGLMVFSGRHSEPEKAKGAT